MLLDSRCCCVYSGKQLATTTSHSARRESGNGSAQEAINLLQAPSLTHQALAALQNHGRVHHWIQQYHDEGLAQQCGFPQEMINEIHGSRHDPSNPVVHREGILRTDLFEALRIWEDLTDLCLYIGTSRGGGLNSDCVFRAVCRKAPQRTSIGGVVISLQRSPNDSGVALKIYAKSDHVLEALLTQLHIRIPAPLEGGAGKWQPPEACLTATEDVFIFPYDSSGIRLHSQTRRHSPQHRGRIDARIYPHGPHLFHRCHSREDGHEDNCSLLDLRVGAQVVIRAGVNEGAVGEVVGKTQQGHYRLQFRALASHLPQESCPPGQNPSGLNSRRHGSDRSLTSACSTSSGDSTTPDERGGGTGGHGIGTFECVLGWWWLESAARGGVPSLPVTNLLPLVSGC